MNYKSYPLFLLALGIFIFLLSFRSSAQVKSGIPEIIQRELEFASQADSKGIKFAFDANMDSTGIIVNGNRFVNAHKAYAGTKPSTVDLLSWQPQFAVVNHNLDFGFTTGPYLYYAVRGQSPNGSGNYFSIWKKDGNKEFKVLFDGGVINKKATTTQSQITKDSKKWSYRKLTLPKSKGDVAPPTLTTTDQLQHYRESTALVLRPDVPIQLAKEVSNALEMPLMNLTLKGSGYDSSGAMYYCYGNLYSNETPIGTKPLGYFVQVWRFDGSWKMIADVMQY